MLQHLGFLIGLHITLRQGARDRVPGRGVCSECGAHRDAVYVRWDGTLYCDNCIAFDLAEANPSDEMKLEQKHPAKEPAEVVNELLKERSLYDDFDPRVWRVVP